jgi:hypothetical protein
VHPPAAGDAYFAAETDKIWSQAGIGVNFNLAGQIDNSSFLHIDDSGAYSFDALARLAPDYQSSTVVDMFLVETVAGAYGEGWFGAGGLVIAMDTVLGFSPTGRIDTIAHELGHNLGLVPLSLGGDSGGHSSNPAYLMASGGVRNVPGTSADVSPDGLGLDQIPQGQIDLARQSSLLQDVAPEPVSVLLAGCGLLALVAIRRGTAQ